MTTPERPLGPLQRAAQRVQASHDAIRAASAEIAAQRGHEAPPEPQQQPSKP